RISKISAKRIAASTPRRSTGVRVISAASSGRLQSSRKPYCALSFRYSSIYRPAWRISQTGVYGVFSRRQAARKDWLLIVVFVIQEYQDSKKLCRQNQRLRFRGVAAPTVFSPYLWRNAS